MTRDFAHAFSDTHRRVKNIGLNLSLGKEDHLVHISLLWMVAIDDLIRDSNRGFLRGSNGNIGY